MISPYAKRGFIDHQTLSFDAYVKFIEDDFLGSRCWSVVPRDSAADYRRLSGSDDGCAGVSAVGEIRGS